MRTENRSKSWTEEFYSFSAKQHLKLDQVCRDQAHLNRYINVDKLPDDCFLHDFGPELASFAELDLEITLRSKALSRRKWLHQANGRLKQEKFQNLDVKNTTRDGDRIDISGQYSPMLSTNINMEPLCTVPSTQCRICEYSVPVSQLASHSFICSERFRWAIKECTWQKWMRLIIGTLRWAESVPDVTARDVKLISLLYYACSRVCSIFARTSANTHRCFLPVVSSVLFQLKDRWYAYASLDRACLRLAHDFRQFYLAFYDRICYLIEESLSILSLRESFQDLVLKLPVLAQKQSTFSYLDAATSYLRSLLPLSSLREAGLYVLHDPSILIWCFPEPPWTEQRLLSRLEASSLRGKYFEIIKPISRGARGKVYLVRKIATHDIYAMKIIKGQRYSRKQCAEAAEDTMMERKILGFFTERSPIKGIVPLYYAFQSRHYAYLIMEYLLGGDLTSLLKIYGVFPEDMARYYMAHLVDTVCQLHACNVVHRDLKPDNVLIDRQGQPRLIDFGLAVVEETSVRNCRSEFTVQGTPDYLSPEALLYESAATYDKSTDVWALGIILFEWLTGCPPFHASTPQQIFNNISNYKGTPGELEQLSLGLSLSAEAGDLLLKWLNPNPFLRLPLQQAKRHAFFSCIQWEQLWSSDSYEATSAMPPPWVPLEEHEEDICYFEVRNRFILSNNFSSMPPTTCTSVSDDHTTSFEELSPDSKATLEEEMASINTFTYRNVNALHNLNMVKAAQSPGAI